MYGFITALEFRVSESDLAAAIGARSEGVDEELTDLADVRREVLDDSFLVATDENGNMTVSRVVRESVEMDLETLETHYRLGYLASDDFDIGDVDAPSLCYMQKHQEYRPAEGDDAEGHYRFVYVADNSTLEFVKLNEHLNTTLSQRDSELFQANRTVDALQGQLNQLTGELAQTKGVLESVQKDRDDADRALDEAREAIDTWVADVQKLKVERDQANGFLSVANAALQLLREENAALRNEGIEKERVITEAGESINRAAAEITERRNRVLTLESAGADIWALVIQDPIKSSADVVSDIAEIITRVRDS
jgi:hypothetical protein